jgi:protein-S-isoprenylcysteine O-methyltransferase Ste14
MAEAMASVTRKARLDLVQHVVVIGLLLVLAALIVWRLLDEERFLATHLVGYAAYRERIRHRPIPHVW